MESRFARLAAGALAAFGMNTASDTVAQERSTPERSRQEDRSQTTRQIIATLETIQNCAISTTETGETSIEITAGSYKGQRVTFIDFFQHPIIPAEDPNDTYQFYTKIENTTIPIENFVNVGNTEHHIIAVPVGYHVVRNGTTSTLHRNDETPQEIILDLDTTPPPSTDTTPEPTIIEK